MKISIFDQFQSGKWKGKKISNHIKIDREEICSISTTNLKQVAIPKPYGNVGKNDGKKTNKSKP